MATKVETGELELVLGSKQLLSVFFIVVILLGLFFTMGYIVGRNSVPPVPISDFSSVPRNDQKSAFDNQANQADADAQHMKPVIVPPVNPNDGNQKRAASPNLPNDQVAEYKEPVKPEIKPEPKPVIETKQKPAEKAEKKEASKQDEKNEGGKISTGAPRHGHYLQVAAMPEKEAQKLANILRNKSFNVQLTNTEKGDLFRVLVGPVAEKSDLTRLRESLDTAGLNGKKAFPRKY